MTLSEFHYQVIKVLNRMKKKTTSNEFFKLKTSKVLKVKYFSGFRSGKHRQAK